MTHIGLKLHALAQPRRRFLLAAAGGLALIGAANGLFFDGGLDGQGAARFAGVAAFTQSLDETGLQRRLGWHGAVTVTDVEPHVVTLLLLDRDGGPLPAVAVSGELRRIGTADARGVIFTPAGPSLWRAPAGALAGGDWDLRLEIVRPDGPTYRAQWHLQIRGAASPAS